MDRINLAPDASSWRDTPSALVVAHPGHQVRLHGWLEAARPRVFLLTDGSGHSGRPRLGETTRYLRGLDIEPGRIFGHYTDRDIYERLLGRDFDFFTALADELTASLAEQRVGFVAGDAAEGYNSIHDVCRILIDAAVSVLNRGGARRVASFDFPVVKRPDDCPDELRDNSVWLRLDDAALARKLDAARTYYPELFKEVRDSLGVEGSGPMKEYLCSADACGAGLEIFRVECLRPAAAVSYDHDGAKPFYERHGERQVEAGLYDHVIRYRDHIAPIAERLRRHAA